MNDDQGEFLYRVDSDGINIDPALNPNMRGGFLYRVEVVDNNGNVVESEDIHNLVPIEGLNHILNVVLKGSAQASAWFVGLFEGNYTPTTNDVMATFAANSTENTTYSGGVRKTLTLGTVAAGAVDNTASVAEFPFSGSKTIYGAFISSSSSQGGTSGTLLSAVRFSSPKAVAADFTLRVPAGFALASL